MNLARLTILIPTYNERANVVSLVHALMECAPDASVVVIDDSSPDGTADAVRELQAIYPMVNLLSRPKKEGLGKAYLNAFQEVLQDSRVEWTLMMDADHSHDPKHIVSLWDASTRADVVIGSRYVVGGDTVGWKLWRKLLSRYANIYCRLITGMPVMDATGGYNLLRTSLLQQAPLTTLASSGYAFQIELKYLLWRHGARFVEVPIVFKERREGESKISRHIIREGIIAPWKMRFKK